MLMLVLRLVHVASGALWVGMMTFTAFFLAPALEEVGPDGSKVMAALQRRRLMTIMPVLAVLTLVSGFWLYLRFTGGSAGAMRSGVGLAFGLGGAAALIAFAIGMTVARPAMLRATALAQDPAGNKEEAQRLRRRSAVVTLWVARLLFFALGAMAVARYL